MAQANDPSKIFPTDPEIAAHKDFVKVTNQMLTEHIDNFGNHERRNYFPCVEVIEPKLSSDWRFKHHILRPCVEFPGAAYYHFFYYQYSVELLNEQCNLPSSNMSAANLKYSYKNFSVVIKKDAPGQFNAYSVQGGKLVSPIGPFGSVNELVNALFECSHRQFDLENYVDKEVATVSVYKLKQKKCTVNQFVKDQVVKVKHQQQLSAALAGMQSNMLGNLGSSKQALNAKLYAASDIMQTIDDAQRLNTEFEKRDYTKQFPEEQQLAHKNHLLLRTREILDKLNTFLELHKEFYTSPTDLWTAVYSLTVMFKKCEEQLQLEAVMLESCLSAKSEVVAENKGTVENKGTGDRAANATHLGIDQKSGSELQTNVDPAKVLLFLQNLPTIINVVKKVQNPGFLARWQQERGRQNSAGVGASEAQGAAQQSQQQSAKSGSKANGV